MQISNADPFEKDSGWVYNFSIRHPDNPAEDEESLCFGFKYLGGDPTQPKNWEFDHVNHFKPPLAGEIDNVVEENLDPQAVEAILKRHSFSIAQVLNLYIERIN